MWGDDWKAEFDGELRFYGLEPAPPAVKLEWDPEKKGRLVGIKGMVVQACDRKCEDLGTGWALANVKVEKEFSRWRVHVATQPTDDDYFIGLRTYTSSLPCHPFMPLDNPRLGSGEVAYYVRGDRTVWKGEAKGDSNTSSRLAILDACKASRSLQIGDHIDVSVDTTTRVVSFKHSDGTTVPLDGDPLPVDLSFYPAVGWICNNAALRLEQL